MKKRFISFIVSLLVILPLFVTAGAESDVRDTNFFTPREHADVSFADMDYTPVDVEGITAEIESVRALCADSKNVSKVREAFLDLSRK